MNFKIEYILDTRNDNKSLNSLKKLLSDIEINLKEMSLWNIDNLIKIKDSSSDLESEFNLSNELFELLQNLQEFILFKKDTYCTLAAANYQLSKNNKIELKSNNISLYDNDISYNFDLSKNLETLDFDNEYLELELEELELQIEQAESTSNKYDLLINNELKTNANLYAQKEDIQKVLDFKSNTFLNIFSKDNIMKDALCNTKNINTKVLNLLSIIDLDFNSKTSFINHKTNKNELKIINDIYFFNKIKKDDLEGLINTITNINNINLDKFLDFYSNIEEVFNEVLNENIKDMYCTSTACNKLIKSYMLCSLINKKNTIYNNLFIENSLNCNSNKNILIEELNKNNKTLLLELKNIIYNNNNNLYLFEFNNTIKYNFNKITNYINSKNELNNEDILNYLKEINKDLINIYLYNLYTYINNVINHESCNDLLLYLNNDDILMDIFDKNIIDNLINLINISNDIENIIEEYCNNFENKNILSIKDSYNNISYILKINNCVVNITNILNNNQKTFIQDIYENIMNVIETYHKNSYSKAQDNTKLNLSIFNDKQKLTIDITDKLSIFVNKILNDNDISNLKENYNTMKSINNYNNFLDLEVFLNRLNIYMTKKPLNNDLAYEYNSIKNVFNSLFIYTKSINTIFDSIKIDKSLSLNVNYTNIDILNNSHNKVYKNLIETDKCLNNLRKEI